MVTVWMVTITDTTVPSFMRDCQGRSSFLILYYCTYVFQTHDCVNDEVPVEGVQWSGTNCTDCTQGVSAGVMPSLILACPHPSGI
jgi:hypothetical protein